MLLLLLLLRTVALLPFDCLLALTHREPSMCILTVHKHRQPPQPPLTLHLHRTSSMSLTHKSHTAIDLLKPVCSTACVCHGSSRKAESSMCAAWGEGGRRRGGGVAKSSIMLNCRSSLSLSLSESQPSFFHSDPFSPTPLVHPSVFPHFFTLHLHSLIPSLCRAMNSNTAAELRLVFIHHLCAV